MVKSARVFLCVTALGMSVASTPSWAIVAHAQRGLQGFPGESVVRPGLTPTLDAKNFDGIGIGVEIVNDDVTGAPRLISAESFTDGRTLDADANVADYLDVIRDVVDATSSLLGVAADDLVLVKDSVLMDKDVQFFDFDVVRSGMRINDANVAFRFKQGRLIQIQAQTFAEAASDLRADAASLTTRGTPEYRVVQTADGYHLVRVLSYVADINGELHNVQVEAATGAVYQAVSQSHFAAGSASAMVYPRTWFGSSLSAQPMSETTLFVGSQAITTGTDGSFAASSVPKLNGFKGKRVDVRVTTGTLAKVTGVSNGTDYSVNYSDSSEKNLAQAMIFHHVNKIVQIAKRYISTAWLERALVANANLSQTCNAFWNGSTLNFYSAGGGCANTALVADVVYHEWGHGLDANTGGIADSAYSEGFGDIMAMLITRESNMAVGFKTDGSGIRNLEPNKVYPRDRGEVHAEGLIIAGTFWDLYKALSAKFDADTATDLVSKYAFKTIFTARAYTNVYNALLVVDDNDGNLNNKTPNFCEINAAFTAHGLATADASCN